MFYQKKSDLLLIYVADRAINWINISMVYMVMKYLRPE